MGEKKVTTGKKPLTSAERRERDKARRAERKARQQKMEDAWRAQVATHFGYLETSYGFHVAEVNASTWWETFVRYESASLAVKVTHSVEFDRAELWLVRLVEGKLPEYPIFINPDTPINYVILDRALQNRAPEEAERLRELGGLSDEAVERSLAFLSSALRTYCDDTLHGDLAIFDAVAEQIHQEVREHPQEIRVVLPDTTKPGEELPLVEKLRKNYPEQPIKVEMYSTQRRPRRRKSGNGGSSPRAASDER